MSMTIGRHGLNVRTGILMSIVDVKSRSTNHNDKRCEKQASYGSDEGQDFKTTNYLACA